MATVEILRLALDGKRLGALSAEQRFTFFFLGHAFNELMSLQKLVARTMPQYIPKADQRTDGAITQCTMLVRLLGGKVVEAVDRLNSDPVAAILRKDYQGLIPDLPARIKAINRTVQRAKWQSALRSRHAFHYPSLDEWQELADTPIDGQYIYIGEMGGNSLFYAADVIANLSAFSLVNKADPMRGFGTLLDELYASTGLLGDFLLEAAGRYAYDRLLAEDGVSSVEPFDEPTLEGVTVPYFVGRSV